MVRKAIQRQWSYHLELEAIDRSTLNNCNNTFVPNSLHLSLQHLSTKYEIKRANIKWRILTGTYSTQSRRFTCNQIPSPTCLLCKDGKEDLKHFILDCATLKEERSRYIPEIVRKVPHILPHITDLYNNQSFLLQFIIDHSHPDVQGKLPIPASYNEEIEKCTQQFLLKIHESRIDLINAMSL